MQSCIILRGFHRRLAVLNQSIMVYFDPVSYFTLMRNLKYTHSQYSRWFHPGKGPYYVTPSPWDLLLSPSVNMYNGVNLWCLVRQIPSCYPGIDGGGMIAISDKTTARVKAYAQPLACKPIYIFIYCSKCIPADLDWVAPHISYIPQQNFISFGDYSCFRHVEGWD